MLSVNGRNCNYYRRATCQGTGDGSVAIPLQISQNLILYLQAIVVAQ